MTRCQNTVVALLLVASGCQRPAEPPQLAVDTVRVAPANRSATPSTATDADTTDEPQNSPEPVLVQTEPAAPLPVYRPDDPRRQHDDDRLRELGIHRLESRRLRLYTDVPASEVADLPGLVDQLYVALEDYFGELPPDRAGTDFQMTGYLIRDMALFRETGLIPDDLPSFEHGRHVGNEFWLRDQRYPYYRAHLLLHEATHCFMTFVPDRETPVWYLEGMAELFGTHRLAADGTATFAVMPASPEEVAGWGRVSLIRRDFSQGTRRSMPDVFQLVPEDYLEPEAYAWSWALCKFLSGHPRYAARFQALGRERRGARFYEWFSQMFADDAGELATEWALFVVNLQYGYDLERAAIDFKPGTPLALGESHRCEVTADHGWQSSGVALDAGGTYRVTAAGQVVLDTVPRPWLSEARGISFDYVDGIPVGRLLACIVPKDPAHADALLRVLPVGTSESFTAPLDGALYLRVNDSWSKLADNTGAYQVTVERTPADSQE